MVIGVVSSLENCSLGDVSLEGCIEGYTPGFYWLQYLLLYSILLFCFSFQHLVFDPVDFVLQMQVCIRLYRISCILILLTPYFLHDKVGRSLLKMGYISVPGSTDDGW